LRETSCELRSGRARAFGLTDPLRAVYLTDLRPSPTAADRC
jgi:hypothetical protein